MLPTAALRVTRGCTLSTSSRSSGVAYQMPSQVSRARATAASRSGRSSCAVGGAGGEHADARAVRGDAVGEGAGQRLGAADDLLAVAGHDDAQAALVGGAAHRRTPVQISTPPVTRLGGRRK